MKPKLVIFDLDGTLLDTIDDLKEAVNHAMGLRGFPTFTRNEVMAMVGHGARNLMRKALPDGHKDDDMVDAAYNDFRDYYITHIDIHTKPFVGIQNLLAKLHQEGVMLAVASNKFQEGTEHLIKEFFPEIPFVAVLGGRPGFPLKPDPEIVGEVLRKAGVDKEEAVMVGDSPTDMRTAANGGIRGIAVGWGYRDMRDIEGITIVETVDELQKLLLP
ncbi:MAG: HAD-IA family hydrolase [Bacteroidales bacterium]|nr:HAD-IA family hydrolase [Bacteroidales bacterium]